VLAYRKYRLAHGRAKLNTVSALRDHADLM
jgi:hypothetical protein